jgi:hypothetical protein
MPRRRRLTVLVLCTAVSLSACADDGTSPTEGVDVSVELVEELGG